ncbi:MAG: DUF2066 domain-containing protein [Steroidobacteraceae bacterium]
MRTADAAGRSAVVFYIRELKGLRDYTMAQGYIDNRLRYLRLGAFICLTCATLCLAEAGRALTRAELYQATAPVANQTEASRPAAFAAALRIVLVRVTGRRTADEDPALAPLISNASRYVQQYRAAPDNQLWVAFDGAAIERWLTQNGQPVWGRERPPTFIWLAVQSGAQPGTVITADDASELKMALDSAAALRGVPLRWPTAAELQQDHMDYAALAGASPSTLAELGHRLGGEGTLIGHAATATLAAGVHWTFLFQDRSSEFSGALEGVNRAADTYAGIFAVSGTLGTLDMEVTGVSDIADYALVQGYLESLTFIAHVGVEALNGDTVRFRLISRGGLETLQHALALNGRLQPIAAGDNGVQRFQLRR